MSNEGVQEYKSELILITAKLNDISHDQVK